MHHDRFREPRDACRAAAGFRATQASRRDFRSGSCDMFGRLRVPWAPREVSLAQTFETLITPARKRSFIRKG